MYKTFVILCCIASAMCAPNRDECERKCTLILKPICGSDGQTYSNQCLMEAAACRSNTEITVAHDGPCADALSATSKRCQKGCTKELNLMCGSDGVTYGNKCLFEIAACEANMEISIAHARPCKTAYRCQSKACTREFRPVCGTDGKTYGNECMLRNAGCESNMQITKAHEGPCSVALSGCQKPCTRELNLMCGSDGVTYNNKCLFEIAACEANMEISIAHAGPCKTAYRCQSKACTIEFRPVCGA